MFKHFKLDLAKILNMLPEINYIAVLVAALIPGAFGALYFGPLLGKQWLASLGKTKEEMEPKNPAVVYGLSFVLALMMSMFLKFTIELVHKGINESGELVFSSFHTFKHGALHGAMLAITLAVPVMISFAMFHKMKAKTIVLGAIFWVICFALMGGILDVWS